MIVHTDTDHAPWTTVSSNDKKRARLNAMRYFLNQFDYEGKDHAVVREPDPHRRAAGRRPLLPHGLNGVGWGRCASPLGGGVGRGRALRVRVVRCVGAR